MRKVMSVGQLAKAAGVGVETIRYYQRRGLLSVPAKPLSGQRRYSDASLRQIAFIRRAQEFGFTLEEIRNLLVLADGRQCSKGRAAANSKAAEIAARVKELNRVRRRLAAIVKLCDDNRSGPCPFMRVLNGDPPAV